MTTHTKADKERRVSAVVSATHTFEGAGFGVFRPFPTAELSLLDPFLLLDEMEPTEHQAGGFRGAPDHPHRGFETVTYMLEGEIEHRDSNGGHGIIGPGDVQWMTAGDGIVHSEMPSRRLQTEGGTVHGFQLWVNLPRQNKRTKPRYQTITADRLGTARGDRWQARVIAGSILGASGPTDTYTPIMCAHLTLEPGAELSLDLAPDHSVGLYAFKGAATVGGTELANRHLAVSAPGGGALSVVVRPEMAEPCEVLAIAGRPLEEPVARYGPFVMNTAAELHEAIGDFNNGRMGTIAASAQP